MEKSRCVVCVWGIMVVCVVCFLFCFFPTSERPTREERGGEGREREVCGAVCGDILMRKTPSPYQHVVLIVIDAMRADFTTEMEYFQGRLRSGDGLGYVCRAGVPTVTLPRIKSLMSGQTAQFSDFLFNFHPSSTLSDNILFSLTREKKRIHFYGDDTWQHLYPHTFAREEGVASFYVADTVEVDLNVTRNLKHELSQHQDWNLLIAHYLGLDHIGHLGGDKDSRLPHKLKEMDDVIHYTYSSLFPDSSLSPPLSSSSSSSSSSPSSLLVIVSDHGMTERGTHGGTTQKETEAFLAFVGPHIGVTPKREKREEREEERGGMRGEDVSQLDFAVTLACLMGVEIPRESEGRVILSAVSHLGVNYTLFCALQNVLQLIRLNGIDDKSVHFITDTFDKTLLLHSSCLSCLSTPVFPQSSSSTSSSTSTVCIEVCRDSLSNYSSLLDHLSASSSSSSSISSNYLMFGITLSGIFIITLLSFFQLIQNGGGIALSFSFPSFLLLFSFGCKMAHFLSLFSSSMIEEEHQTFHFFSPSFFLLFFFSYLFYSSHSSRKASLLSFSRVSGINTIALVLFLHLITRKWMASGMKIFQSKDEEKDWMSDVGVFSEFLLSFTSTFSHSLLTFVSFGMQTIVIFILDSDIKQSFFSLSSSERMMMWVTISGIGILLISVKSSFYFGFSEIHVGIAFYISLLFLSLLILTFSRSHHSLSLSILLIYPVSLFLFALLRVYLLPLFVLISLQSVCVRNFVNEMLEENGEFYQPKQIQKEKVSRETKVDLLVTLSDGVTWISRSSYFLFGNSNSVSSIDFAGTYIGFSSFSYFLIPLFIFLSLFSGPFLWLCSQAKILSSLTQLKENGVRGKYAILWNLLFIRSLSSLGIGLVSVILRDHLFSWSVFAPKLLFEFAWLLFDIIQTLILLFLSFLSRTSSVPKEN